MSFDSHVEPFAFIALRPVAATVYPADF